MSEDGVVLDNQDNMLEEILNFFGKLYNISNKDSYKFEGLDCTLIYEE